MNFLQRFAIEFLARLSIAFTIVAILLILSGAAYR